MKIYIAGKITNDENYKEKFARAEKTIKERVPDVSVLNPAALPERMTRADYMRICFAVFLSILLIFSGVVVCLISREYDRMYNSPPSITYIEEDLEEIFMTKNVTVHKVDMDKDAIYYKVSANGFNYTVEYKLSRAMFIYWEWRYVRYIETAV